MFSKADGGNLFPSVETAELEYIHASEPLSLGTMVFVTLKTACLWGNFAEIEPRVCSVCLAIRCTIILVFIILFFDPYY